MLGIFLLFCALFLLLALFTFDANDPSLNLAKSGAVKWTNKAGLFGAYVSGHLNDWLGIGALLVPCVAAALGTVHLSGNIVLRWWRWTGFFLLSLCLLIGASAFDLHIGDLGSGGSGGGGMVGNVLHSTSVRWLSPFGSFLLWFFVFLAGVQLVANFSWFGLWQLAKQNFAAWRQNQKAKDTAPPNPAVPHAKSWQKVLHTGKSSWGALMTKFRQLTASLPQGGTPGGGISQPPASAAPASSPAVPHTGEAPAPAEPDLRTDDNGFPWDQSTAANALGTPQVSASRPTSPFDDDDPFAPSQDLRPDPSTENSAPPMDTEPDGMGAASASGFGKLIQPAQRHSEATDTADPLCDAGQQLPETLPECPILASAPASQAPMPKPDTRLFHDLDVEPVLPSPDLLNPPGTTLAATPEELQGKGQALMNCLGDFGIDGQLACITPGPVVTMFEVRPAPGIRVSKIANLSDDLSMALKAVAVRIQAPIPGSDTVGIEIPNERRQMVNFRELVESSAFEKGTGPLTMILGQNIAGEPFMADLTRMPHMLVAGATGAGKSVCLNSILVSLLYKVPPKDMRLLLVDPKRIELAVYADLPHLVHPVVTEMEDAKNALDWAVQDMKKRYKTFERLGVRNIVAYHQKLESFGETRPADLQDLEHMPYMVIVIDELADLMMTAAREVETSIVRLAQLARAAGIHMILATQRPSVDVVTGLIKANFPCRISFQVTSKHDSRTILDQVGAEHLLGRGDMLFKPSGGRLLRLHGPFLSDEEVQAVANHWKGQLPPNYQVDFANWSAEVAQSTPAVGADATGDALYGEARDFVLNHGRASISLLQRHLKIGFNRAARLMEQFEREGLIGPADGSKPRSVIK